MTKKILIFHYERVSAYPPVLSLIENLLDMGHEVELISFDGKRLNSKIRKNKNFTYIDIEFNRNLNLINKFKRRIYLYKQLRKIVNKEMEKNDILWTTTDFAVRILKESVFKYKHVMQLMELERKMPLFGDKSSLFTFPIDKYARKAWKVVVPEINRAYIQQAWWNLSTPPIVLPNKPYYLNSDGSIKSDKKIINEYFTDKRKIILYLGFIGADRNLTAFAEAMNHMTNKKDFAFYIVGRVDDRYKNDFEVFLKKYNFVKYLGSYPAPTHLNFLKRAYIGLLPYYVQKPLSYLSPLNSLYCAPNKIWEYAGYNVPMVGTNVLGLKYPFEKYNIGYCCPDLTVESICENFAKVDKEHETLSQNCSKFYNSISLTDIVKKIIDEE